MNMNYTEIISTLDNGGQTYYITVNSAFVTEYPTFEQAVQYLKDHNMYNDYLLSCED